jgi:hypothetical protein
MNWQNIKVSSDNTYFIFEEKPIFEKRFIEVLKFHAPGLAPVKDESGAYHIDSQGNSFYSERYMRTFGYYCNRAAVVYKNKWFHITEKGEKAYDNQYAWTGNFQENLCTVRDIDNHYFHIDLAGNKMYDFNFRYAGDFKDRIACVKIQNGNYKHIDNLGNFINEKEFLDLGVFHKNYAVAKDLKGWFHIDKKGFEVYNQRYLAIEPFYNGFALVTEFNHQKTIIDEQGNEVLKI